jgi:hypothetical protein
MKKGIGRLAARRAGGEVALSDTRPFCSVAGDDAGAQGNVL